MEVILSLLVTPVFILIYLILFGGKECYYCGHRLREEEQPIRSMGKRSCKSCWLRNESI